MRRRYLVAYDIREPERLRRVHQVCKTYGDQLQYSVFICDLDERERLRCRADLEAEMHLGEDSAVLVDLGETHGRARDCFEFLGHRRWAPPRPGPTIL